MLTGINGTIKLVGKEGGQKIQLAISEDDYEEFKKYKDVGRSGDIINDKFYAGYTLDDQQLYITGFYPQGDNIIIDVKCVGEKGGKYQSRLEEMKNLLGLNNGKEEIMVKNLSKHPITQLLKDKEDKIKELETAKKEDEGKQKELQTKDEEITALKAQQNTQEVADLQQQLQAKDEEITALKAQQNTQEVADLQQQLQAKDEKIKDLEAQLSNQPNAVQLQAKEDKIKELEAKINQPNTEVENLKKDLQAQNSQVQQLTQKNKELEAKNKTTEQPKQGNGAKYTATVGMGLAAGLIAFTALERTVKLEMLVMIGIAVASALVAGGITYAVLPSTQVDGAEAQEVSGDKKSKQ
ncbi:hypothetical protein [Wolbachia endosymbiont (group A) of Agelastica alni]|uniref:hypothetical protein n=1 Tax=Wolbachia endosymbiont (group A) of Agelastica alni TaxID=3066130 RepID=UPI00333E5A8E